MTKYLAPIVTIFLVLFSSSSALAASPGSVPLDRVVKTLEKPFAPKTSGPAAIRDFKADFSQISRIASLDRVQKGSGTVTVQFGHHSHKRSELPRFRWSYRQPTPQEIISDGETLWVYQPENQQVIQSKIDLSTRKQENDPLLFLTELGHLATGFELSWAAPKRDEQGHFLLKLTPKHPSPLLQHLVIAVRKEAVDRAGSEKAVFPIASTTVFDAQGNSTTIRFHHVATNLSPSAATFHFKIPEGVEVLHSMPQLSPGSAGE